jgi:8-oxo-dGTP pyrophosphatase MutT (NUDIX family)
MAKGRWEFPMGTIEKDETPEVTALREIAEETGLPIKRLRIVGQLPPVNYAFDQAIAGVDARLAVS